MLSARSNDNYNPQGGVGVKYTPLNSNPSALTVHPQGTPPSAEDGSEKQFNDLRNNRKALFASIANYSTNDDAFNIIYYCNRSISTLLETARYNPLHPLLVISSGRSGWIKQQYDKMTRWIEEARIRPNQGISSADYFPTEDGINFEPIPIYFSKRLQIIQGHERNVYMFVHESEYQTYMIDLAGTGIRIIGWGCSQPVPVQLMARNIGLVGFGMSRAVVINFAKKVFRDGCSSWSKAWLLDDNVCYLNATASATARTYNLIDYEQAFAGEEFDNNYFNGFKADNNPKSKFRINDERSNYDVDKLVQQMVYINLSKLSQGNYNFSPYFIFSNEDYALVKYLGRIDPDNIHGQFTNVHIIKGQVTLQTGADAAEVRMSLLDLFCSIFNNEEEQRFEVYGQFMENSQTLTDCVHTTRAREQKVIREEGGKTCAKAVEQMFRMSISNGGTGQQGGSNQYLPIPNFFTNLFQIEYNFDFKLTR